MLLPPIRLVALPACSRSCRAPGVAPHGRATLHITRGRISTPRTRSLYATVIAGMSGFASLLSVASVDDPGGITCNEAQLPAGGGLLERSILLFFFFGGWVH